MTQLRPSQMTRLTAGVRKDYKRDSRDVNQRSSGVPSLPPLRSITDENRRSAALAAFQAHTASRYGWRRAERLIERHLASDDVLESGMRRTRTPQSARDYQHLQTMRALHESMDDGNDELRALLDFATPPPHAYSDQLAFPSPPMQARESNDDLSDNTNELRSPLDIAQPPMNLGEPADLAAGLLEGEIDAERSVTLGSDLGEDRLLDLLSRGRAVGSSSAPTSNAAPPPATHKASSHNVVTRGHLAIYAGGQTNGSNEWQQAEPTLKVDLKSAIPDSRIQDALSSTSTTRKTSRMLHHYMQSPVPDTGVSLTEKVSTLGEYSTISKDNTASDNHRRSMLLRGLGAKQGARCMHSRKQDQPLKMGEASVSRIL